MEPDVQSSTRRFYPLPEQPKEPHEAPLMLDDLLGHHAADADTSDAEGTYDREIFAGLVTP